MGSAPRQNWGTLHPGVSDTGHWVGSVPCPVRYGCGCFRFLGSSRCRWGARRQLSRSAGGAITYNAGAGETNTAVIVKQQTTPVATVYFVGDQNPNVTVTASAAQGCLPTPPALGLPKGYLCTVTAVTPVTSLVENLATATTPG